MPTAPLSAFPMFDTSKRQDFVDAVNADFHHGDIDIHPGPSFRAVYNAIDLGRVSLHGAFVSSGVSIASASNNGSFVLILICAGEMHIHSGRADVRCMPGGPLALLDFSRPTTIRQSGGFVNYTLRFTRQGLENSLAARYEELPLLAMLNQVDPSNPFFVHYVPAAPMPRATLRPSGSRSSRASSTWAGTSCASRSSPTRRGSA